MDQKESIVKPTGAILVEIELSINAPREAVWNAFVNEITGGTKIIMLQIALQNSPLI